MNNGCETKMEESATSEKENIPPKVYEPIDESVWPPYGYEETSLGTWSPINRSKETTESCVAPFFEQRVQAADCTR